jgi:hypothetical protein
VTALAAVLGTGIFTSGVLGVTNAGAATPKVVVTPSTGLKNHATVTVSGTGYREGRSGVRHLPRDTGEDQRDGSLAQDEVQGCHGHHRQRKMWHDGGESAKVRGQRGQRDRGRQRGIQDRLRVTEEVANSLRRAQDWDWLNAHCAVVGGE